MNIIDILILAVLGVSLIFGLYRGFPRVRADDTGRIPGGMGRLYGT